MATADELMNIEQVNSEDVTPTSMNPMNTVNITEEAPAISINEKKQDPKNIQDEISLPEVTKPTTQEAQQQPVQPQQPTEEQPTQPQQEPIKFEYEWDTTQDTKEKLDNGYFDTTISGRYPASRKYELEQEYKTLKESVYGSNYKYLFDNPASIFNMADEEVDNLKQSYKEQGYSQEVIDSMFQQIYNSADDEAYTQLVDSYKGNLIKNYPGKSIEQLDNIYKTDVIYKAEKHLTPDARKRYELYKEYSEILDKVEGGLADGGDKGRLEYLEQQLGDLNIDYATGKKISRVEQMNGKGVDDKYAPDYHNKYLKTFDIYKGETDEENLFYTMDKYQKLYDFWKQKSDKWDADNKEKLEQVRVLAEQGDVFSPFRKENVNPFTKRLAETRGMYDAVSEIYLTNRPIEKMDKGYLGQFGTSVAQSLLPDFMEEVIVPSLQSEGIVTDRGKLDNINKVIFKDKIPISKEDINQVERNIGEHIASTTGGLVGSLREIILLGGVSGMLQKTGKTAWNILKARNLAPTITNAYLNSGNTAKKVYGFLYKAGINELTFSGIGSMPLGVATGLETSHLIPTIKFANSTLGKIIEPLVNAAWKQGVGVTGGMELGELLNKTGQSIFTDKTFNEAMGEFMPNTPDEIKEKFAMAISNALVFGGMEIPKYNREKIVRHQRELLAEFKEKGYEDIAELIEQNLESNKGWENGDVPKRDTKEKTIITQEQVDAKKREIKDKLETQKTEQNVKENETGLPSSEQGRETTIEGKPIEGTSREKVEVNRDVQAYEQKKVEEKPQYTIEESPAVKENITKKEEVLKEEKKQLEQDPENKELQKKVEESERIIEEEFNRLPDEEGQFSGDVSKVLNDSYQEIVPFNETKAKIQEAVRDAKNKLKERFREKFDAQKEFFKGREKEIKELQKLKLELLNEKNKVKQDELKKKLDNKLDEYIYNTELTNSSRKDLINYIKKEAPKNFDKKLLNKVTPKLRKATIGNINEVLKEVESIYTAHEIKTFKETINKTKEVRTKDDTSGNKATIGEEGIEYKKIVKEAIDMPLGKVEEKLRNLEEELSKITDTTSEECINKSTEKRLYEEFGNIESKSLSNVRDLQEKYKEDITEYKNKIKEEIKAKQQYLAEERDKVIKETTAELSPSEKGLIKKTIKTSTNVQEVKESNKGFLKAFGSTTRVISELAERLNQSWRKGKDRETKVINTKVENISIDFKEKERLQDEMNKTINEKRDELFGSEREYNKLIKEGILRKEKTVDIEVPSVEFKDIKEKPAFDNEIKTEKKKLDDTITTIRDNRNNEIKTKTEEINNKYEERLIDEVSTLKSDIETIKQNKKKEIDAIDKNIEKTISEYDAEIKKIGRGVTNNLTELKKKEVSELRKKKESLKEKYKQELEGINENINSIKKQIKQERDNEIFEETKDISNLKEQEISNAKKKYDEDIKTVEDKYKDSFKETKTIGYKDAIHMIASWEGGGKNYEKLKRAGVTQEQIDILKREVPQPLIDFATWLRDDFFPKYKEPLLKAYQELTGTKLEFLDGYLPTKESKASLIEEGFDLTNPSVLTSNVKTKTSSPYEIGGNDIMQLLDNWINNTSSFIAMSKNVKEFYDIVNNRKVLDAIEGVGNMKYLNELNRNIQAMYKGEEGYKAKTEIGKIAQSKAYNFIRNNAIRQAFLFNLKPVLGQVSGGVSIFSGEFGRPDKLIAEVKMFTEPGKIKQLIDMMGMSRDYINRNFIQEVGQTSTRSTIRGNMFGDKGYKRMLGEVLTVGVSPVTGADKYAIALFGLPVMSLEYRTKYKEYISQNIEPKKAQEKAREDAIRMFENWANTQGSSRPLHTTSLQKSPDMKLFNMFLNTPQTIFRKTREGIQKSYRGYYKNKIQALNQGKSETSAIVDGFLNKDVAQGLWQTLIYGSLTQLAYRTLSSAGTNIKELYSQDEDKRENAWIDMLYAGGLEWTQGILGLGTLTDYSRKILTDKNFGSEGDNLINSTNYIFGIVEDLNKLKTAYEDVKEKQKNLEPLSDDDRAVVKFHKQLYSNVIPSALAILGMPGVMSRRISDVILDEDKYPTKVEKNLRLIGFTKDQIDNLLSPTYSEKIQNIKDRISTVNEDRRGMTEQDEEILDEYIKKKEKEIKDLRQKYIDALIKEEGYTTENVPQSVLIRIEREVDNEIE